MNLTRLSPQELKQRIEQGSVRLVDVREADEFARVHISSAESNPLSKFDVHACQRPGAQPVLYCRSGARSTQAAKQLAAAGFGDILHLEGGIAAWESEGLPVEKNASAPISLMRQVQIVAGTMIATGTLLGAFVSPWFLLISGGAGFGLLIAGLTDTCAMASLLSMMPWNRAD